MKDWEQNIARNVQRLFEAKYGRRCTLSDETIHKEHREMSAGGFSDEEVLEFLKQEELSNNATSD